MELDPAVTPIDEIVYARSRTAVNVVELPWQDWRAIIDVLRAKALPYMLEHADYLEQQLERHGPGQLTVRLSLTDDVYLRSYNHARCELGIPLAADE